MTVIEWDRVGERTYQTGVDKGLLALDDGTIVPWNGITGVEESSNSEVKSFYLDGIKFLENVSPGDFAGTLKAITYPDEFDEVNGIKDVAPGLSVYEQPPKSFNLSYRTKKGNDILGDSYGYKIHLFYNLVAIPGNNSFDTVGDAISPTEFSWSLTGTPVWVSGFRPTVHLSIDSNEITAEALEIIESILYGTETTEPRFPSIDELIFFFPVSKWLLNFESAEGDTVWEVTATTDVTLDVSLSEEAAPKKFLLFKSPNGWMWFPTATGDGSIDIVRFNPPEGITSPNAILVSNIVLKSYDNSLWVLSAINDGSFDISPA